MRNMIVLALVLLSVQVPISAQTKKKVDLVVQTGHSSVVQEIKFSPDGKLFASASDDETIKLWETATGKELRTFGGDIGKVFSIAFNPDGRLLASGGEDKVVRLWNVATGQEVAALRGHLTAISAVLFSPSGKSLLTSGGKSPLDILNNTDEESTIIWDLENQSEITSFPSPSSNFAFSPDGEVLAVFSGKTLKLDWVNGRETTFDVSEGAISSVEFAPHGKILVSEIIGEIIKVWSVTDGQAIAMLRGHSEEVYVTAFSPDLKYLASGGADYNVKYWDIKTGKEAHTFEGHSGIVRAMSFSPDGKFLVSGGVDHLIKAWNLSTGTEAYTLEDISSINITALDASGKLLAVGGKDGEINLWDLLNGKRSHLLKGHEYHVQSIVFSPDSTLLASGGFFDSTIRLWNTTTGEEITNFKEPSGSITSLAFSPNGKFLASGGVNVPVKVRNIRTGEEVYSFTGLPLLNEALKFNDDGDLLACGNSDGTVTLWELRSGREIFSSKINGLPVSSLSFNTNEKTVATYGYEGRIKLWNWETGQEVPITEHANQWLRFFERKLVQMNSRWIRVEATSAKVELIESSNKFDITSQNTIVSLIALDEHDWAVITPDGRFDTNRNLEETEGLHWILPDAPFTPLSFEVFMRDYYEPKLLLRLMRCAEEGNCGREFKPIRDLSALNRTQPKIEITQIKPAVSPETVEVSASVSNVVSEYQRDSTGKPLSSGVYDVRLFRDGQLVGHSTSEDKLRTTFRSYRNFEEELAVWREANKVALLNGTKTFTFKVKLPNTADHRRVEFSAYAFNDDRVKSETARAAHTITINAHPNPPSRVAYLLTFGVNRYDNPAWDLEFAGNDAREMSEIFSAKLRQHGGFNEVVEIPLISDDETIGNTTIQRRTATKANMQTILELLADKRPTAERLENLERAVGTERLKKIRRTNPGDMILISFSSHGYADQNGIFYILPTDIGKDSGRTVTNELLRRSISSDELSLWLRDVDASEMVMIVDACYAASAVEGKDFKPAPMGSRGLGQLAYDKGMKILTATQAANAAIESGGSIGHGLLTFALLREGLEWNRADFRAADKTINLKEWLEYGEYRVPGLYNDLKVGRLKGIGRARAELAGIDGQNRQISGLQQPSLFDFTRKKSGIVLAQLP